MLATLGEAALRTLLLSVAVQTIVWLLRVRRPQLLLITWTIVLVASLAMPMLQWATPIRLGISASLPTTMLAGPAHPLPVFSVPQAAGADQTAETDAAPELRVGFELAYCVVTAILLLRLALGVALTFRLLVRAAPVRCDWVARSHIRISDNITAPVTVANTILLPTDAVDWPEDVRQAVLAHERAHVERWDFAMLLVSQANRALFWFNPASWWLHRRLTALAELASDDRAIQVTGDRHGYASVLLEMGRRSGPLLRGLAMARRATLPGRIEHALAHREQPSPASRFQRMALAAGAAGLSLAAASPEPRLAPTPDQIALAELQPVGRDAQALPPARPEADGGALPPPTPFPAPVTHPVASQFRPAARAAATPAPRRLTSDAPAVPPSRAPRLSNRTVNEAGLLRSPPTPAVVQVASPIARSHGAPSPINAHGTPADSAAQAPATHRNGRPPPSEPAAFRLADQQVCDGAYLPGPIGAHEGGWLSLVRAKFFRAADGSPWLTFHLGGQTPVNLPVTVTGTEVRFIGKTKTEFTLLPSGANHLTGTTQRPYGTIDFACGGPNGRMSDRAS